jgi:ubiquinone/menaquinone biosynthesis C-methylase UbiE
VGPTNKYKLDEINERRLMMLNETFGKSAIAFLQQTKVQQSRSILDVGCGNGFIAHWISEQLIDGKVVGIDNRTEQILQLQQQYKDKNNSLCFQKCDAFNLNSLNMHFDFVVCSLLLKHVGNPLDIMAQVNNVLEPGGTFFVFDNAWSNYSCHPHSNDFDKLIHYFKQFYIAQDKSRGYDYGLYAAGDLIRKNFVQVKAYIEEITFTDNNKMFFKLHFESMKELLFEKGIIDSAQFNKMNNRLDDLINDHNTIIKGTVVNTIGQKIKSHPV